MALGFLAFLAFSLGGLLLGGLLLGRLLLERLTKLVGSLHLEKLAGLDEVLELGGQDLLEVLGQLEVGTEVLRDGDRGAVPVLESDNTAALIFNLILGVRGAALGASLCVMSRALQGCASDIYFNDKNTVVFLQEVNRFSNFFAKNPSKNVINPLTDLNTLIYINLKDENRSSGVDPAEQHLCQWSEWKQVATSPRQRFESKMLRTHFNARLYRRVAEIIWNGTGG